MSSSDQRKSAEAGIKAHAASVMLTSKAEGFRALCLGDQQEEARLMRDQAHAVLDVQLDEIASGAHYFRTHMRNLNR